MGPPLPAQTKLSLEETGRGSPAATARFPEAGASEPPVCPQCHTRPTPMPDPAELARRTPSQGGSGLLPGKINCCWTTHSQPKTAASSWNPAWGRTPFWASSRFGRSFENTKTWIEEPWRGRVGGTLHKNIVIPSPGLGVLSPSDLTALQPGAALDSEFHYVQEPARSRVVGSGRQGQQGPLEGTGRGPEAGWVAGAADGGRSSRDRPSAICQLQCAVDSPAATVPPSVTSRTISTSLASGSGWAFVPQGQTWPNDSVDHGSSPRSRETRTLPPTRSATGTQSAHLSRVQQGEPPWSPAGPHGTLKPTGPWMEHAVRVSSRRAGARRGSSVPSEEGARAARTPTHALSGHRRPALSPWH